MEIDAKLLKKLEELKKQLEGISGQKIDASPEQLIPFFFRVSLLSSEDGRHHVEEHHLPRQELLAGKRASSKPFRRQQSFVNRRQWEGGFLT